MGSVQCSTVESVPQIHNYNWYQVMFLGLKARLYAFGAALLAAITVVLRLQALERQRDLARTEADTLRVRHSVIQEQKKIKRKEEKRLVSHKAELIKDLKKEDFDGIDNLTDSNDY